MGNFNMPPGVSVSDIPGNGPGDMKAEAFYDLAYEQFEKCTPMSDEDKERLANWMWEQMSGAYHDGYNQGMADEAAAKEDSK